MCDYPEVSFFVSANEGSIEDSIWLSYFSFLENLSTIH